MRQTHHPDVDVGLNIAYQRLRLQISQAVLATRLNRHPNQISRWEQGVRVPDAYELLDLAAALECSPQDLLQKKTSSL